MKRMLWLFCWFASAACAQASASADVPREEVLYPPPVVERLPGGARLIYRFDEFSRYRFGHSYAFSLYENGVVVFFGISNMRYPGARVIQLQSAEVASITKRLSELSDRLGAESSCGSGHRFESNHLFHYRDGVLVRTSVRDCFSDLFLFHTSNLLLGTPSVNREICPHFFVPPKSNIGDATPTQKLFPYCSLGNQTNNERK